LSFGPVPVIAFARKQQFKLHEIRPTTAPFLVFSAERMARQLILRSMLLVFVFLLICLWLPLLAFAWAGTRMNVPVQAMALGIGPRLMRLGRLHFKLIPIGGNVKFVADPSSLRPTPLDSLSRTKLVLLNSSGLLALLLLSSVLLQIEGLVAFYKGIWQLVAGALWHETGYELVRQGRAAIADEPWWRLLGLTAAKVAAWCTLPFPLSIGACVLAAAFRGTWAAAAWEQTATNFILLLYFAFLVSWLVVLFNAFF
jgi:hypothetical protein